MGKPRHALECAVHLQRLADMDKQKSQSPMALTVESTMKTARRLPKTASSVWSLKEESRQICR
jgi:hypothetical protein